jgi:cytochrome P450
MIVSAPVCNVDLFSEAVSLEPYGLYRELRKLGPVVHFTTHDFLALTRYRDVRAAGIDHQAYSSADGVGLLDEFNAQLRGTVLASDPPEHTVLRAVLSEKLAPRAVNQLQHTIKEQVSGFVAEAVEKGSFDGMSDLAERIPVEIVADLIGLPKHGRGLLLPGADALFGTFGPKTPALQAKLQAAGQYFGYIAQYATREALTPGSWGAAIFDAVDAGTLRPDQALPLMSAYLVAGMDTTVNSLGFLLQFLASVPGLWERVKQDPSLGRAAYYEALRMESPVQVFFRRARADLEIDGTPIPTGSKVALLYGSANRDHRQFGDDAEEFVAKRNPTDHLAFGFGTHNCAGQGLARLEAQVLIDVLVSQVDTLELVAAPTLRVNPVVRGYERLPLRVTPKRR